MVKASDQRPKDKEIEVKLEDADLQLALLLSNMDTGQDGSSWLDFGNVINLLQNQRAKLEHSNSDPKIYGDIENYFLNSIAGGYIEESKGNDHFKQIILGSSQIIKLGDNIKIALFTNDVSFGYAFYYDNQLVAVDDASGLFPCNSSVEKLDGIDHNGSCGLGAVIGIMELLDHHSNIHNAEDLRLWLTNNLKNRFAGSIKVGDQEFKTNEWNKEKKDELLQLLAISSIVISDNKVFNRKVDVNVKTNASSRRALDIAFLFRKFAVDKDIGKEIRQQIKDQHFIIEQRIQQGDSFLNIIAGFIVDNEKFKKKAHSEAQERELIQLQLAEEQKKEKAAIKIQRAFREKMSEDKKITPLQSILKGHLARKSLLKEQERNNNKNELVNKLKLYDKFKILEIMLYKLMGSDKYVDDDEIYLNYIVDQACDCYDSIENNTKLIHLLLDFVEQEYNVERKEIVSFIYDLVALIDYSNNNENPNSYDEKNFFLHSPVKDSYDRVKSKQGSYYKIISDCFLTINSNGKWDKDNQEFLQGLSEWCYNISDVHIDSKKFQPLEKELYVYIVKSQAVVEQFKDEFGFQNITSDEERKSFCLDFVLKHIFDIDFVNQRPENQNRITAIKNATSKYVADDEEEVSEEAKVVLLLSDLFKVNHNVSWNDFIHFMYHLTQVIDFVDKDQNKTHRNAFAIQKNEDLLGSLETLFKEEKRPIISRHRNSYQKARDSFNEIKNNFQKEPYLQATTVMFGLLENNNWRTYYAKSYKETISNWYKNIPSVTIDLSRKYNSLKMVEEETGKEVDGPYMPTQQTAVAGESLLSSTPMAGKVGVLEEGEEVLENHPPVTGEGVPSSHNAGVIRGEGSREGVMTTGRSSVEEDKPVVSSTPGRRRESVSSLSSSVSVSSTDSGEGEESVATTPAGSRRNSTSSLGSDISRPRFDGRDDRKNCFYSCCKEKNF